MELVVLDLSDYDDEHPLRLMEHARVAVERVLTRMPRTEIALVTSHRHVTASVPNVAGAAVLPSLRSLVTYLRRREHDEPARIGYRRVTVVSGQSDESVRAVLRTVRVEMQVVSFDEVERLTPLGEREMMRVDVRFIERWLRIDQSNFDGDAGASFHVAVRTEDGRFGFLDSASRQGWGTLSSMAGWQRAHGFSPRYFSTHHRPWR